MKCDFFPHLLFSSTSFISSNTRKVTHSCFSIVSCLGKHLGREINSFYAHDTNSLSLWRCRRLVSDRQNGRFIEDYLLFHHLDVASLRRTLENLMWKKPGKSESLWPFSVNTQAEEWQVKRSTTSWRSEKLHDFLAWKESVSETVIVCNQGNYNALLGTFLLFCKY